MSDVKAFIDTIGQDVNATVAPRVKELADHFSAFTTAVIQDLFHRYRPELAGELHTKLMNGRVELVGNGIKLDLKHRETGATVASLDIPVSLTIKVDDLAVKLQTTTVKFDVVR
jgi:hypothetical protein